MFGVRGVGASVTGVRFGDGWSQAARRSITLLSQALS